MRNQITRLHSRMFGVNENEIPALYFQYLGYYKLLILIFNLVPYIAMKITRETFLMEVKDESRYNFSRYRSN